MLRRSSESEEVLMCRWASASMKWRREEVLIRLPFWRDWGVSVGEGGVWVDGAVSGMGIDGERALDCPGQTIGFLCKCGADLPDVED